MKINTQSAENKLPREIPGSGQFRFLRAACLVNFKGSVGLILTKASNMRISIPLFLLCVLPKRHMMGSYLRVLPVFLTLHSFIVTFFTLDLRLFLFCCK